MSSNEHEDLNLAALSKPLPPNFWADELARIETSPTAYRRAFVDIYRTHLFPILHEDLNLDACTYLALLAYLAASFSHPSHGAPAGADTFFLNCFNLFREQTEKLAARIDRNTP